MERITWKKKGERKRKSLIPAGYNSTVTSAKVRVKDILVDGDTTLPSECPNGKPRPGSELLMFKDIDIGEGGRISSGRGLVPTGGASRCEIFHLSRGKQWGVDIRTSGTFT